MSIELEGLEFQIEVKSDNASKNIDALANSLERLKNATKGLYGLHNLSDKLDKLNESLKNFNLGNTEKIEKLGNALQSLSNAHNINIPDSISKRINDIAIASKKLDDADLVRIEKLGSALKSLNATKNVRMLNFQMPDTKKSEDSTSTVGEAASKAQEVNKELNYASNKCGNLKSVISKDVGGALSNIASKVKQIGNSFLILPNIFKASIGNAINNISASFGNFLHQLKRVAMYRAIRTMLSQLTQGFREGMNNLYQYSLMMGGTFAGSMDRLATSAQYLRNSLGSMMAPIIKALVPAIDFLINKIATVLNFINMLFARLSGANSFTIAKKSAKGFGNAVSNIGGTAKKAAKGFRGAANDIGRSVKKATKEIHDATLGIDELNIITQKNNEDLGIGKNHVGGGNGLGGSLDAGGIDYGSMFEEVKISDNISDFIDRLKEAFKKADWKTIGTLLGEKVNEAVEKVNWSAIGHKLGYFINGAVQTIYWFLDTVNFNNIGSRIAELLNWAMKAIDFSFVGRMIIKPFTSAIDIVIGFLRKLDWELVGKSIKHSLIGLCDELIGWLNKYDWFGIGISFTQNLCKFIKGIDVANLSKKIGETLVTATHNAIKLAAGIINPAEKFFDTMKRKNEIEQQFGKEIGKHKFLTIPIVPAIFASEYMGDSGAGLYQGMADGWNKKASKNICEFLAKVKNSSSEWWDNVKSWWNGVHDKTVQFSAKLIDNAQDWWRNAQSFWNGVSNKIVEFSARVINHASTWWQNVKDFWNNIYKEPVIFFANVHDDAKAWWNHVQIFWNNVGGKIVMFSVDIHNNIKALWEKVKSWWYGTVGSLRLNVTMPKVELGHINLAGFNLPWPKFSWNARGGILDGAQLFGRIGNSFLGGGEAGKEAILPLERHTQWMDILAQKVRDGLPSERDNRDSQGMRQVIEYLANMEGNIRRMAVDMRRQADKPERTTVQIGHKTINDAVVAQQNANGYRFIR